MLRGPLARADRAVAHPQPGACRPPVAYTWLQDAIKYNRVGGTIEVEYSEVAAGGIRIPVIALCANVMPAAIERGLEAGFLEYAGKPVDFSQLTDALDVALAIISGAAAQERQA